MNISKLKNYEYQVPRDFLLIIVFESNRLNTYCYNINGEIVININKTLSKLSKWTIARKKISQKIKYEMLGSYNIIINEHIEDEYKRVSKKYENTFIDSINKLFVYKN